MKALIALAALALVGCSAAAAPAAPAAVAPVVAPAPRIIYMTPAPTVAPFAVPTPVAKLSTPRAAKPTVASTAGPTPARTVKLEPAAKTFPNCTAMNKVYRHGVGRPGAKDHVSGSSRPVTTFKKSLPLYRANAKSDRDKDGIACEKL